MSMNKTTIKVASAGILLLSSLALGLEVFTNDQNTDNSLTNGIIDDSHSRNVFTTSDGAEITDIGNNTDNAFIESGEIALIDEELIYEGALINNDYINGYYDNLEEEGENVASGYGHSSGISYPSSGTSFKANANKTNPGPSPTNPGPGGIGGFIPGGSLGGPGNKPITGDNPNQQPKPDQSSENPEPTKVDNPLVKKIDLPAKDKEKNQSSLEPREITNPKSEDLPGKKPAPNPQENPDNNKPIDSTQPKSDPTEKNPTPKFVELPPGSESIPDFVKSPNSEKDTGNDRLAKAIPEPASTLLIGLGAILLLWVRHHNH